MSKKFDLIYKITAIIGLLIFGNINAFAQTKKMQASSSQPANNQAERIGRFEKELEQLRTLLKIPGMSAAIVKDRQVIWSKGFGYSDYENKIAATPETSYEVASISKTFAATLLMQLVEQGKVSLDDPMSKYSSQYKGDDIKIKHLLTHTSEGIVPGETYEYNGNLFANLFDVIVNASGKRYRLLVAENILDKIGMTGSSPGDDISDDPAKMAELLGEERVKNYLEALKRLAPPYKLYGADEIIHTFNTQVRGLSPASGIVSTVIDLAKYDAAIDRNFFVQKQTQEKMWTPTISTNGKTLPYGLGWFVQYEQGLKLVWHNGNLPDLYSALYLKIPEKNLTFILLANSDTLSMPFKLAKGNIMNSAFADSFLRTFIFEENRQAALPAPNWGTNDKTFRNQLKNLEKRAKGYKYEFETASNDAINQWLESHRSEARNIIKVDPKIYDAYVGQYKLGNNPITISSEGGKLVSLRAGIKMELFPLAENVFFSKVNDAQITFVKDDKGQVTEIKIRRGENESTAQKL